MEEFSIEQKAQRYDKALEKAKNYHSPETECNIRIAMENLFPELKESEESEDERIRKDIVFYIAANHKDDGEKARWLYWLEKQGELVKHYENKLDKCACDNFNKGYKKALEKQGEQKLNPVLDIEIPFGANDSELQEASYHIPEGFHAEIDGNRVVIKRGEQKPTDNEMIEILRAEYEKGRADAIEEMHNHTWSEEDELHIKELESLVKQEWAKAERENDRDKIHKMSDLSFFLKTLKPQPKQEWSEEDEKHVNDLIAYFTADMSLKHTEEDTANWLKSLRPQPQWKSSDEQMKVLQWCMPLWAEPKSKAILESLINDLKKLREEYL